MSQGAVCWSHMLPAATVVALTLTLTLTLVSTLRLSGGSPVQPTPPARGLGICWTAESSCRPWDFGDRYLVERRFVARWWWLRKMSPAFFLFFVFLFVYVVSQYRPSLGIADSDMV